MCSLSRSFTQNLIYTLSFMHSIFYIPNSNSSLYLNVKFSTTCALKGMCLWLDPAGLSSEWEILRSVQTWMTMRSVQPGKCDLTSWVWICVCQQLVFLTSRTSFESDEHKTKLRKKGYLQQHLWITVKPLKCFCSDWRGWNAGKTTALETKQAGFISTLYIRLKHTSPVNSDY